MLFGLEDTSHLRTPQRLPVGTLPGPGGGDGRDARRRVREAGGRVWLVPSSMQAGEIAKVLREGYDVGLMNDGLRDLADQLAARLPAHRHPPRPQRGDAAVDRDLGLLLVLMRPDRQDFQGTAVTVEVARKLEVQELVLVLNKVLPSVAAGGFVDEVSRTYQAPIRGRAARGPGDAGARQQRAVHASFTRPSAQPGAPSRRDRTRVGVGDLSPGRI